MLADREILCQLVAADCHPLIYHQKRFREVLLEFVEREIPDSDFLLSIKPINSQPLDLSECPMFSGFGDLESLESDSDFKERKFYSDMPNRVWLSRVLGLDTFKGNYETCIDVAGVDKSQRAFFIELKGKFSKLTKKGSPKKLSFWMKASQVYNHAFQFDVLSNHLLPDLEYVVSTHLYYAFIQSFPDVSSSEGEIYRRVWLLNLEGFDYSHLINGNSKTDTSEFRRCAWEYNTLGYRIISSYCVEQDKDPNMGLELM